MIKNNKLLLHLKVNKKLMKSKYINHQFNLQTSKNQHHQL